MLAKFGEISVLLLALSSSTILSFFLLPLGVAKSQICKIFHIGAKGNLLLTVAVSSFYRYYPSGDAFASGSDDATVSN